MVGTISADNCFGGIQSFEKLAMTDFDDEYSPAGFLLRQPDQALTRDCINLCRQQPTCLSFGLDYTRFRCAAYAVHSQGLNRRANLVPSNTTNLFEKVCYLGVHREEYQKVCGVERLWAFERVKGAFLEGFVETTLSNIGSKDECAKSCMMEASFTCRSADYDHDNRVCRLSKEDRRTQPQAFRLVFGSARDYLENQCAAPGPTACLYDTKPNVAVITMDSLVFAHNIEDCEHKCDKEYTFNCRSFSIDSQRCFLSGDDSVSLSHASLPVKHGAMYGEKKCVTETCTHGIFTYEKVTGMVLRSALATSVPMPHTASLGVTGTCRDECDKSNLNCPAFSVSYLNSRCDLLDRNSQGQFGDFVPREGESYFEKICLRGPEVATMCQDKFWAFERVIGYELTPLLYERVYHFVQSRRYCEEYCLQEKLFVCRSALYNDETTECKLSREDRRTKPANYIRNQNPKINYLENQCIRSHSQCPYENTPSAYPTYTDIVESRDVNSRSVCEQLCSENKQFICRSYAFYSSNNKCLLSGDDRASGGSSAVTLQSGMTYYERRCAKTPNDHYPTTEDDDNSITSHLSTVPGTASVDDQNKATTHVTPKPTSPSTSNLPDENTSGRPTVPGYSDSTSSTDTTSTSTTNGNTNSDHTDHTSSPTATHNQPNTSDYPSPTNPTVDPSTITGPFSPTTSTSSSTNGSSTASSSSKDGSSSTNASFANTTSPSPAPNNLKCGPNGRFTFERIPGFEPVGGFFSLLYSDKSNPGIVTECSRRCEHNIGCTAFIMDYTRRSCFGLFENASIGRLDLRISPGRDYFEGFCVASHLTCPKLWTFDRIVDQASIGVQPKSIIRYLHKPDCRLRCLEERRFNCMSASYDATLRECKLFDQDRNSGPLRLVFTKGTDYIENQCNIDVSSCRFHPIERDITIVAVTKALKGSSTFFCEQECNRQKEFNCRSYTYLDQTNIPGGNLCLLSSDSRGTSQKEAMGFRPRALYAEKDCRGFRKGRVSSTPETTDKPQQSTQQLPPPSQPSFPPPPISFPPQPLSPPIDLTTMITKSPAETIIPPRKCSTFDFTYEKTYGFDLRFARRERSRVPPSLGITTACQDECTRRGHRCRAFSIEYGPNQHCFLLEDSAGENHLALSKIPNIAYFEKICLKAKPCGRLWSFERIIGYQLTDLPDREIHNVDLRSDCQDHCLAESTFVCRSATFDYSRKICKLFKETQRSRPSAFKATSEEIDYLENHCVKEPSSCQYKDFTDTFSGNIDRVTHAFSLTDCQRQCDTERLFPCRALNYESYSRECLLSSYDIASIGLGQKALQLRRHSIYSEKGNCEQVTVQCNPQDMVLTLNFDTPFMGRVYAKGNPAQCFEVGTGQTRMQFSISFGTRCGTRQEGLKNFVNEIVVQQHAVIMTDSDRTIKVMCSLNAIDQTVTLHSANQGRSGIDVTSLKTGKSALERPIPSVVTNTAAPPTVVMRILDRTDRDATLVSLGDELTMKIEILDITSAFAISARNLYARSSSGESLYLIDANGCPTDASIFPSLRLDPNDGKSLRSTFKAFRFPSTGVVNFEVQIRFCPDKCFPVKCPESLESFGRRKRSSLGKNSDGDDIVDDEDELEGKTIRTLGEPTSTIATDFKLADLLNKNRSALHHRSEGYTYNVPESEANKGYNYEVSLHSTTMVPHLPAPLELVGTTNSFNKSYQFSNDYKPAINRMGSSYHSPPSALTSSYQYNPYSSYNQPDSGYNYGQTGYGYGHHSNTPMNQYPSFSGYGSNQPNSYVNNYQNYENSYQHSQPNAQSSTSYGSGTRVASSNKLPSSSVSSFSSESNNNYPRELPSSPSTINIIGTRINPSGGVNKGKKFKPPRPLPRPKDKLQPSSSEIIGIPCNTGPAILYTAIIVTLAHCLVVVCGYFYYRKYVYYTGGSKLFTLAGRTVSTENITTITRNPRATNSNVFFGSPGLISDRPTPSSSSSSSSSVTNVGFRSLYSTGALGSPP
uniref:ZP domain-containing protein n=1 Tax=Tetranychus urticae TaxID=32264 RepID=T1JZ41_TETUR